jgi:hypothetical protein
MALRRLRILLERGDQFHTTEVILILITYGFGISLRNISESRIAKFSRHRYTSTVWTRRCVCVCVYACDIWETGFL